MLAWSTSRSVPIRPMAVARASSYNPHRELVYANPQDVSSITFGMQPWDLGLPSGMHGLDGCGCDPVGGCGCHPDGLHGLGYDWSHVGLPDSVPRLHGLNQNVSLDQIIQNAFNWLSGLTQSALPPSAAVPPQYSGAGPMFTQLQQWIPYIIGGLLVYKLVK